MPPRPTGAEPSSAPASRWLPTTTTATTTCTSARRASLGASPAAAASASPTSTDACRRPGTAAGCCSTRGSRRCRRTTTSASLTCTSGRTPACGPSCPIPPRRIPPSRASRRTPARCSSCLRPSWSPKTRIWAWISMRSRARRLNWSRQVRWTAPVTSAARATSRRSRTTAAEPFHIGHRLHRRGHRLLHRPLRAVRRAHRAGFEGHSRSRRRGMVHRSVPDLARWITRLLHDAGPAARPGDARSELHR